MKVRRKSVVGVEVESLDQRKRKQTWLEKSPRLIQLHNTNLYPEHRRIHVSIVRNQSCYSYSSRVMVALCVPLMAGGIGRENDRKLEPILRNVNQSRRITSQSNEIDTSRSQEGSRF